MTTTELLEHIQFSVFLFIHFFLPFVVLALDVELVEPTLDAREGAFELALLDLTLSSALFCYEE